MKNPFRGTNKKCRKCSKKCKQFENVTIIVCPMFKSTYKADKTIERTAVLEKVAL